jgi:hypothetical protein
MHYWAVEAGERHKGCLLRAFARSSNGSHRSLDPLNDNTVAPMIVVAAITRITIPIANAILAGPQHHGLVAPILPQVCAKLATHLAKLRRGPAMCVNYAVARLDPSSCEWRLTNLCDRLANADVHQTLWRMNSVESGTHKDRGDYRAVSEPRPQRGPCSAAFGGTLGGVERWQRQDLCAGGRVSSEASLANGRSRPA